MKTFLRRLYALITMSVLLLTSGCALLGNEMNQAAKGAGKLVTYYCENVTDPTLREQFRAAVNQHAAPHSVRVSCVQGGEPLDVSPETIPSE